MSDEDIARHIHEEEEVRWRTDSNPSLMYPPGDWRYEVANGDTELGYHDWVVHKIEAEDACALRCSLTKDEMDLADVHEEIVWVVTSKIGPTPGVCSFCGSTSYIGQMMSTGRYGATLVMACQACKPGHVLCTGF